MTLTPSCTSEQWRPIPGLESYEASDLGHVRRYLLGEGWRVLPLARSSDRRYLSVNIRGADGRFQSAQTHRLVATAWHGIPQPGDVCRHLDGDGLNNRADNLAWGTPAQNSADSRRHGTLGVGSRNGNSSLREADVVVARRLAALGVSGKAIAESFGVSNSTISMALSGKTWAHVTEPPRRPRKYTRRTTEVPA